MARKYTKEQQELLKEYRVKRDRANQQLRELEKLAKKPGYESILKFAYANAARDVKELGLGDLSKIRYRTPKNTNKLKSALNRVNKFLEETKTSTKTGIDTTYTKYAITLNEKFGTDFSWQDMKKYLDSINWDELKKEYGSGRVISVIRSLKENKITAEDVKNSSEKYQAIADTSTVEGEITKILTEKGLNIDMLYNSGEWVEATDEDLQAFID